MATRLFNIVRFAGLGVGNPTVLPHFLNVDGRAVIPDEMLPSAGGFTIAGDDTNVTVTRLTSSDPGSVDVLVKSWYSPSRAFGTTPPPGAQPDGSLVPQPFVGAALSAGLWNLDVPAIAVAGPVAAEVNQLIRVQDDAGGFNVNLPAISAANQGQPIVIKKISGNLNVVSVVPNGADTIDGIGSLDFGTTGSAAVIVSDGVSNWNIVAVSTAAIAAGL